MVKILKSAESNGALYISMQAVHIDILIYQYNHVPDLVSACTHMKFSKKIMARITWVDD